MRIRLVVGVTVAVVCALAEQCCALVVRAARATRRGVSWWARRQLAGSPDAWAELEAAGQ